MQMPGELPARTVRMVVLSSIGLIAMSIAGAWININDLPSSDHATAWWWFGGVGAATVIVAMTYQVIGWRNGSLVLDASELQENRRKALGMLRPILLPVAGLGAILSYVLSPNVLVPLCGMMAGFFCSAILTLMFRSSRPGRAMRAAHRRVPRAD